MSKTGFDFHKTNNNVAITLHLKNNKSTLRQVSDQHPNFTKIVAALGKKTTTVDDLLALIDAAKTVAANMGVKSGGRATFQNGQVYFDGQPVHSNLASKIVQAFREGSDITAFLRFMDNLYQNPSKASVDEMFDFLQNKGFPITEDGCFLAYKGLRQDFKDIHSGTVDNSPGQRPKMLRNQVDDERRNECSYGLHVGHIDYARSFSSGGPVVLVKVNPAHVVAVPKDYNCQKMRVCEYEVLSVYEEESYIDAATVDANGGNARTSVDALNRKIEEIDELYTRDEACAQAVAEGLFATKNAARAVGKACVVELLAKLELGLIEPDDE